MLDLTECWEPRVFFIRDFTPINICRSLYDTWEKQRETQHEEKPQHVVLQMKIKIQ